MSASEWERLRALAEAANDTGIGWYTARSLVSQVGIIADADKDYIAAASPDVLLALLDALDAATDNCAEAEKNYLAQFERRQAAEARAEALTAELAKARQGLEEIMAERCEHGYTDDERLGCGCGFCNAYVIARAALSREPA